MYITLGTSIDFWLSETTNSNQKTQCPPSHLLSKVMIKTITSKSIMMYRWKSVFCMAFIVVLALKNEGFLNTGLAG
jgi:hypothetical protein